jgi:prepilin signal peptidase PulO-like enzyme (type II secretory pathway)
MAKKALAHGHLNLLERATGVEEAALPGMLPRSALFPLTLLCALAVAVLWGAQGVGFWATLAGAVVLGRLVALDATTYTLPHIYTLPAILVGGGAAYAHHRLGEALLAAMFLMLIAAVLRRSRWADKVGQGDFFLLTALFAFLPPEHAFFALSLGCLLWLPVVWRKPKIMVPMGLPIILGWVLWVGFQTPLLKILDL